MDVVVVNVNSVHHYNNSNMITLKADFAWFLVGEKVSKISMQEKQSFEWWKREMRENENENGSKIERHCFGNKKPK